MPYSLEARADASARASRADFLYSAIWTAFLAVPLALIVWWSNASVPVRVLAAAATLVFGVAYVLALGRQGETDDTIEAPMTARRWRHALASAVLLIAIAALTVPALGLGAFSYAPFLASLGVFSLPLRIGLVWSGVLVTAMLVTTILVGGDLASAEVSSPLIVIVFILGMRLILGQSVREKRAQQELLVVREREEISRDVHDILGHTLTAVSLKSQLARRTLRTDPDRAEAELDEVLRLTQVALDDVRATVGRLRIPDLASQLDEVVATLEDAGIAVTVRGGWRDWSPRRRALTAWALREGSTNLLRHADAERCTITFAPDRFEIVDDGDGIRAAEGHGLTGLRRRAAADGGTLLVEPARPGAARPGTRLAVDFAADAPEVREDG